MMTTANRMTTIVGQSTTIDNQVTAIDNLATTIDNQMIIRMIRRQRDDGVIDVIQK